MFKLIHMQHIQLDCPNSKYLRNITDDHGMIQDACTTALYSTCVKAYPQTLDPTMSVSPEVLLTSVSVFLCPKMFIRHLQEAMLTADQNIQRINISLEGNFNSSQEATKHRNNLTFQVV